MCARGRESVIQTYRILLSRRVLSLAEGGGGDSIFSGDGKFKKSRVRGPLRGCVKKGRASAGRTSDGEGRFATRLRRRRWIDVRKTRNSLDPGSSRVAVVVHAINQSIDSFPHSTPARETFAFVVAVPAEKWRHPDAWEIRKGGRERGEV